MYLGIKVEKRLHPYLNSDKPLFNATVKHIHFEYEGYLMFSIPLHVYE